MDHAIWSTYMLALHYHFTAALYEDGWYWNSPDNTHRYQMGFAQDLFAHFGVR